MAIVAIIGSKGGVGKATITVNLSAELLTLGWPVEVLDADSQQTLVAFVGLNNGVLRGRVRAVDAKHPRVFRKAVGDASNRAAYVLIDTPPGIHAGSSSTDPALLAALCADLVLLPAGPSPLDIIAVRPALAVARQARAQRGDDRPLIRFVPSKVTVDGFPATGYSATRNSLAELGEVVLPGIGQHDIAAESTWNGLTVRETVIEESGDWGPADWCKEEFEDLAIAVEKLVPPSGRWRMTGGLRDGRARP